MESDIAARAHGIGGTARSRVPAAVGVFGAMLFLTQVVWTNLTGLGIGQQQLTFDSVGLPRLVVAAVGISLFGLLLAISVTRFGGQVFWDITGLLVVALAVWAVVSAIVSDQGVVVWLGQLRKPEGVLTIVIYVLVFWGGLQVGRTRQPQAFLTYAVIAGGLALVAYGLVQMSGLDHTWFSAVAKGEIRRPEASLDNANFLAGHLTLVLPIIIGQSIYERRVWARVLCIIGGASTVVVLLATVSQGAWFAVVIESVVAAWLGLRSRQRSAQAERDRGPRRSMIVSGLLVVTLLVGAVGAIVAAGEAGLNLGDDLWHSARVRIELWGIALDGAMDSPLFGHGPDTYLSVFRAYRSPETGVLGGPLLTSNTAHSWIFQMLATLGFPGMLLLLAAIVSGLARSSPRVAQSSSRGYALRTGIWLGVLGYAIQSLFNVVVPASTVVFWALLGVCCARGARGTDVPRVAGMLAAWFAGAVFLTVLMGSFCLLRADALYMHSRSAYDNPAAGNAIELAERATQANPLSPMYARGLAQALGREVLVPKYTPFGDAEDVRQRYDAARLAYEGMLEQSPNDYAALAWYAALQAQVGLALEDPSLIRAAGETARRAAGLDRAGYLVRRLAEGDSSQTAIMMAASVPPQP